MINREDMLELSRRMTPARASVARIAGAYFDEEGYVDGTFNTHFLKLSAAERSRNLNQAKTLLLAKTNEELKEYPCLSFDQGSNNSFFLAEEGLSTYEYKRIIKANDRATMLNLMVGLNGYTLCSGIICEELNGSDYRAVPLHADENMMIGYVSRKGMSISAMGLQYLEEIRKFEGM